MLACLDSRVCTLSALNRTSNAAMLAEAVLFLCVAVSGVLHVIVPLLAGFKLAWECLRVCITRLGSFRERAT